MSFGLFVVLVWVVGWLGAVVVHRGRAGVPIWVRLKIFGPNFGWIMVHSFKSFFWPINLVMWFANGRPGPKVVFGKKALQRAAAD